MGETGFAGNWADGLQYCGTIVQQQRLIAFYLFYSTKPELRLMYKNNVTRQALMLHRLLHMWYFSYRVCMARWVSLWVGSLSLIPSRVVILHSLQHHFIISIHPFIVYHHSCSTQGCWSLSQLWWGEGLVHPGHLASPLQGQHRDRQLYCHTFTSIRPVPFFFRAQSYLPVTAASHLPAISTDMYCPAAQSPASAHCRKRLPVRTQCSGLCCAGCTTSSQSHMWCFHLISCFKIFNLA